MDNRIQAQLSEALFASLARGAPGLLITIRLDSYPGTAFTWLVAKSRNQLLFGADHGTTTLENLVREKRATLQVIQPGNLVYLISGTARMVKERIDAAPFNMGLWALDVVEVKDQSWPGVSVAPLGYLWPADVREEMLKMEKAVFSEMLACED